MPNVTRANIRVMRMEVHFLAVRAGDPVVPERTIEQTTIVGEDGAPLPGSDGVAPMRQTVLNARPTEAATGVVNMTPEESDELAAMVDQIAADLASEVETVTVKNADGSVVRKYDRVYLESPITVIPVFTDGWSPDLPGFIVHMAYTRRDKDGNVYQPGETRTQTLAEAGVDLAHAGRMMAARIAAIRAELGVV